MNVDVTIISLIYRSPEYAMGLYEKLLETTPSIASGSAKFFFVANNANEKTLRALVENDIPHMVFNQTELSEKNHYDLGFAAPEYIGRVYAGYNFGIQACESNRVVLINSDMVFGNHWLENLLAYDDGSTIVSCTLVERIHPKFGIFPGAIQANFGSSFKNLKWKSWLDFSTVKSDKKMDFSLGGPYMPALFRKDWFDKIGYYPEGNVRGESSEYSEVLHYGDEYLFLKFKQAGIRHITSSTSYCYHFKEGERATELAPKLQNFYHFLKNRLRSFVKYVSRGLRGS